MRGQVTSFIILAILLVIAGVFMFSPWWKPLAVVSSEALPVQNYVTACLQDAVTAGASLLAIQGGYIVLPENHLQTEYGAVGYAGKDRVVLLPDVKFMEQQLASYVVDTLRVCTGNYSTFADQGLAIESGDLAAATTIKQEGIHVDLTYPLKIRFHNSTSTLDRFSADVNSPLWRAHATMAGVMLKVFQDPNYIDLTYLSGFEGKVDVIPVSHTEFLYSVTYPTSSGPFTFLGAYAYTPNQPPKINMDSVVELRRGETFTKQVQVSDPEGDAFVCADDTPLFDITKECRIEFRAEILGSYNVSITATDNTGRTEQSIQFVIT